MTATFFTTNIVFYELYAKNLFYYPGTQRRLFDRFIRSNQIQKDNNT